MEMNDLLQYIDMAKEVATEKLLSLRDERRKEGLKEPRLKKLVVENEKLGLKVEGITESLEQIQANRESLRIEISKCNKIIYRCNSIKSIWLGEDEAPEETEEENQEIGEEFEEIEEISDSTN